MQTRKAMGCKAEPALVKHVELWEAEAHHSACHPVSVNSRSFLLTVILICTQLDARLKAVFVLPTQSQVHGRRRSSYLSSKEPQNICFWFSNCADVVFPFIPFQSCCIKPQKRWVSPRLAEEEQAPKPHSTIRGPNFWLNTQTWIWTRWSFTLIIFGEGDVDCVEPVLLCQRLALHHWVWRLRRSATGAGIWEAFKGP